MYLAALLELRHRSLLKVVHAVSRSMGSRSVVEMAAGLSSNSLLRAVGDPSVRCIDTDLPEILGHKQTLVEKICGD